MKNLQEVSFLVIIIKSETYWSEWQVFGNKNIKSEAYTHILFSDDEHVVYNFLGD